MRISRRILVLLLLLAAFALRLYRLGVASLWYDETVSTFLAQQDVVELTRHTAGDIHPPLYYYLLHFWGQLAGWSEFAMAFASLFFGILLIALVFRVAREWFNENVARIAAFLVAISPYNLWYSQEVRMYTMGAMLGLVSVYFFVRMLTSRQSPANSRQKLLSRDFIAYTIVTALGIYTLYYFAFLIVFEDLFALIRFASRFKSEIRNQKSEILIWISSQLAIVVLFSPWLPIAFRQAIDPPVPPWRSFTDLPKMLIESFSALALGQSVDPALVFPILILVVAIIAIALVPDRRPLTTDHYSPTTGLFLLGYTVVPLFVIFALSLWKPLYHVRYVFIYSPAFYILLALGLYRILNFELRITNYVSRITFYVLLILITGASAYSAYNFWFDAKYTKDDLRGAVNYVAEHWRPGDAVLIDAGYTYTAFAYYYHQPIAWRGRLSDYTPRDATTGAVVLQTGSIGGGANLGWSDPRSDFYATTSDETRAALDRVFAAHPRVWLLRLYDTVVDPDGIIRDYLAQRGRIIDDQGFAGESFMRVQGYTTRGSMNIPPSDIIVRRNVILGNRIVLIGFTPASMTVRAGMPVDVNVYWQSQEPTNIDERLFVGLYADNGTLVASSDELPVGNALGTSRWSPGEILREPVRLNIPPSVTPGNYILRVMLYNPLTNEPLTAKPSEWVAEDSQVKLTTVRIEK